MKLFLIGTLLFSGGTAVAMQDEGVREEVNGMYKKVRERVQKRVKENTYENLRENGFPYPSEERLSELTEEEQLLIVTAIDQVNATYNWSEMSDEEIKEALVVVSDELEDVLDELGIDVEDDFLQRRFRRRVRRKTNEVVKERLLENLREKGIEYPNEERLEKLTEEQSAALITLIDEFNETYDWANMTDEEILEAMVVVKDELRAFNQEHEIFPPGRHHDQPEPEENTEGTNEA